MEVFLGGTWSRCFFVLGMTAMFFGPLFLSQEALQRGYHAGIFNGSEFLCTADSWLGAVKLAYHLRIKYDIIWYSQKTKSFLFFGNDYVFFVASKLSLEVVPFCKTQANCNI